MTKPTILSKMQQSDQVVHVISLRQAEPLLLKKLVRRVIVQPAPGRGRIAVNLTSLGRHARLD